jgi:hypothetical protein
MFRSILCKWIGKKEVRIEDIFDKVNDSIEKYTNIGATLTEIFAGNSGLCRYMFIVFSFIGIFVVNSLIESGNFTSNWWYLASPLFGAILVAIIMVIYLIVFGFFINLAFTNRFVGAIFVFILNIFIGIGDVFDFIFGSMLHIKIAECKLNKKHNK